MQKTCIGRNESRTASCQHQRVSPCEGQDKIFYNTNVTANFVGLNTECTGDFGAIEKTCSLTGDFGPIAGLPGRAAMLGERNFSSSSGSLHEYMVNESHTENVPFYTRRDPALCKKRVCELDEKQWCTDRNESGTTFGQQRQGCNKCDESRAEGDP